MSDISHGLTEEQAQQFDRDGFIIVRQLGSRAECSALLQAVHFALDPPLGPLEYESEVAYPGAPTDMESEGGRTPRRLLCAYSRDRAFRDWAHHPSLTKMISGLLAGAELELTQNHHNCVMTKHPKFSSETQWHRDIRYWSYDQPHVITAWLALGLENNQCGGMMLIPGSHRMDIDRGRFDASLFLRPELPENVGLIEGAVQAELHSGDVLLFHSNTLHSAGINRTDYVKISLVFSYHAKDNRPIAATRSSHYPEVVIR